MGFGFRNISPVIPIGFEKMSIDRYQFVISQVREARPTHFEGADGSVGQSRPESFEFVAEKAQVEGGVMGHKDAVPDEGRQCRKDFLRRRCPMSISSAMP